MYRFIASLIPLVLLSAPVLAATVDSHSRQAMLNGKVKSVATYYLKAGNDPSKRNLHSEVLFRPDGQITKYTRIKRSNFRLVDDYKYQDGNLVVIKHTTGSEDLGETRVTWDDKKRVEVRTKSRNGGVTKIKTSQFDDAGRKSEYLMRYVDHGIDKYKSLTKVNFNGHGDRTSVTREKLDFRGGEGRYRTQLEVKIIYAYNDKHQLISETRTKYKRNNQTTIEQRDIKLDSHGNWIQADVYKLLPDNKTRKLTRTITRTISYY